MQSVVVRAPATSANLGSGFDCLGLALDLWNTVIARPGAEPSDVDADNLVRRSIRAVFDAVGAAYPGFALQQTNRIPFGRGLGSSAAAIACGVLIGNHCLGSPLDASAVLDLAVRLEGHPDNVTPCLLGGVRAAVMSEGGHVLESSIPLAAPLMSVLFVPEQHVPTAHARGVLPPHVPRADALFNVGRASLLVAAFTSGRFDLLAEATRDRLHQPYRLPLFPPGATLLDTAMEAGALGAFTSGAGPSVLALCADDAAAARVEASFGAIARSLGVAGSALRLALSDRGAHLVDQ